MLEFIDICKRFRHKTVADRISLNIPSGSITAVLGGSGSGKSTLLNIAAGLLKPDNGSVFLHGKCIDHIAAEKRGIAMMFQDVALLPHLNVWQNAAFGLQMRGIDKHSARRRVEPLLEEIGLHHMAEHPVSHLSGGEQQRVALARSLAYQPQALLLDEPFSALDTVLRGQLQQQVKNLVRERNIPAILVTHSPQEACLTAEYVALLHNGRIIQRDTPANILRTPACADAAKLMGCLNVSESCYIPPEAIHINHAQGSTCEILNAVKLPELWQLHIRHHQYGNLTGFHREAVHETMCRVWIDNTQIVHWPSPQHSF